MSQNLLPCQPGNIGCVRVACRITAADVHFMPATRLSSGTALRIFDGYSILRYVTRSPAVCVLFLPS